MSKITLFLLILLCIVFYSCDDQSNPITQDYIPLIIQGKIANYNHNFTTVFASTLVDTQSIRVSESNINGEGEFYIEIPEHQSEYFMKYTRLNYTHVINADSTISEDSINIKNEVKFNKYRLAAESISSGSNENINYALSLDDVYLAESNEFAQVGDYYLLYYYFAEATEITGYRKVRVITSQKTKEFVTRYNVNVQSGWNIFEVTFESQTEDKIVYHVTNQTKSSGTWVIGGINRFSNFFQIL